MRRISTSLVLFLLTLGMAAPAAASGSCRAAVPVTDLGDTGGRGQLRWAITHVCDGGTILVVRRGIITLQIGQLVIP
ncbi:MAG TPA: hypothetical protein VF984_02570, partial [Actinomycetota bacterium]